MDIALLIALAFLVIAGMLIGGGIKGGLDKRRYHAKRSAERVVARGVVSRSNNIGKEPLRADIPWHTNGVSHEW